jgi:hypothetical protein
MKVKSKVFELMRAKDYYTKSCIRKYILGWIVILNYHIAFSGNKRECKLFIKRFSKSRDTIYGL